MPVRHYGPADRSAEPVLAQLASRKSGACAERAVRVDYMVAEGLPERPVQLVCAHPRDDVYGCSQRAPQLRLWRACLQLELPHSFIRRLEVDHAILAHIHP